MKWFVIVPELGLVERCGSHEAARRRSDEIYEAAGEEVETLIALVPDGPDAGEGRMSVNAG